MERYEMAELLSKKAGVTLDMRTKGATVDENLQTTVPGIFAAVSCRISLYFTPKSRRKQQETTRR